MVAKVWTQSEPGALLLLQCTSEENQTMGLKWTNLRTLPEMDSIWRCINCKQCMEKSTWLQPKQWTVAPSHQSMQCIQTIYLQHVTDHSHHHRWSYSVAVEAHVIALRLACNLQASNYYGNHWSYWEMVAHDWLTHIETWPVVFPAVHKLSLVLLVKVLVNMGFKRLHHVPMFRGIIW